MRRFTLLLVGAAMATLMLAVAGVALAATTQTFTNTTPITIPDLGPATPYPSPITVEGATGQVRDVDVILDGFSHTFPDDVNILLEGPQGQKALIMADAGGGCALPDKTIKLNDEARRALPNAKCLQSKSYKPKDHDDLACFGADNDTFGTPAPAEPYASKLSVFDGTDPNGTWNLYVNDDCSGDGGQIMRGWALVIKAE